MYNIVADSFYCTILLSLITSFLMIISCPGRILIYFVQINDELNHELRLSYPAMLPCDLLVSNSPGILIMLNGSILIGLGSFL